MRWRAAIAALVAAGPVCAQVFSPAQEAELRQRYLNSTGFSGAIISPGTVPADRLVGTGITFLTESSSGVVTGRWGRLGISSSATPRVRGITLGTTDFLVNGTIRFNPSVGRVELYNNGWQAMAGGVERVFVGSSSVTGVTALGMQSSSTNLLVGVSGTNGTATFVLTPVGPIGVKGDDGVGNMWFSGAWSAAQPYSSNTLVSYGGGIYVTRVDLLAGNTNTPLDTAAFLLVITSGTDGTDGVDGGGFLWRGPWDAFTGYGSTQSVTHAGSVWVSLTGSTNVEPGVTSGWATYWLQAVEAGTDGGSVVSNLIWTAEEFVLSNPAASNAVYTYNGETWAALRDLLAGSGAPAAGTNWIKLAARGADGSSGSDGTDGADGIGNMWFAQEWDSLRTYSSNTLVVRYQQLYYSKVDVAAGTDPFTQPAYWGVAARRGNDGLNYYFGGEWSGIVTYTNDALVFYSSAWWRSLQASAGVTPALSGSATSYWRRLVEVTAVGETGTLSQVVSRGGDLGLRWATNVPLNHGTGTVPLASLSGITSNQIDPTTDAAYRGGGGGDGGAFTNAFNTNGVTLLYIGGKPIDLTGSTNLYVPLLPPSPVPSNVVSYSDLQTYVATYAVAASNATSVFEIDLNGFLVPKVTSVTGDPLFEQDGSAFIIPRI